MRFALRRARDATGLSQGAVADRMGWSVSKVQRIEAGENAVSGTDLRALLDLYGVTGQEEVDQLAEDARLSRRQRWWTKPEFREHLTPGSMRLLQFEAEAVAIRSYQPVLVPGVFQTREYADFLLRWHDIGLTEEDRRVRLDVRMQRRERFLELADIAGRLEVHVHIVPLQEGAILGLVGQFTLLDLSADEAGDTVLYRESCTRDVVDHDLREVTFHRTLFEAIWRQSLDEEKTIRAINAEAASLRARIASRVSRDHHSPPPAVTRIK